MVCASGCQPMSELKSGSFPLCLVLRDMGNGVTRLESYQLLADPPSEHFREELDYTVLLFPLTAKIEDAVLAAMASLTARGPPLFQSGCFRSITETITEYFFW